MKKLLLLISVLVLTFSVISLGTESASAEEGTFYAGYMKTKTYASGGRVDIDTDYLYMYPAEARIYASKSEVSLTNASAWFVANLILPAKPYIATGIFYTGAETSNFTTAIRNQTNLNKPVKIIIKKDNFYGIKQRTAVAWDGKKTSMVPTGNTTYEKIVKRFYDYK